MKLERIAEMPSVWNRTKLKVGGSVIDSSQAGGLLRLLNLDAPRISALALERVDD
jgi:hypothetical protein